MLFLLHLLFLFVALRWLLVHLAVQTLLVLPLLTILALHLLILAHLVHRVIILLLLVLLLLKLLVAAHLSIRKSSYQNKKRNGN